MQSFLKLITLTALVFACSSKEKQHEASDTTTASETSTTVLPQLTEQQKAEGWKILFDGKSKDGWQIFKGRKNNTWEVNDGALHAIALKEGVNGVGDERSDLMTTQEYGNFELTFEWKISAEGNSGVIFRATEEFEQPYYSGPEFQIVDDAGYPGKLKDSQHSGANFDMHAPVDAKPKPLGEWNASKIVANVNHVEYWLNGSKVVEYEIGSNDWKKRRDGSKWKEWKGYGTAAKGHIDLQDHGSEVWFRNIFIHEL